MEGIDKAEFNILIRLCEGDDVADFVDSVKYLASTRVEGRIYMADNGRYRMAPDGFEFTSGSGIEVFIDDQDDSEYGWNFGRVEYSHSGKLEGYYFYNAAGFEHYQLKPGMIVARRIRK